MPHKNELTVADLALLKVIQEHPDCTKAQLWQTRGRGLWNTYLRVSNLIRLGRCDVVTSDHRFAASIATLRHAKLLADTPHYRISDAGERVFWTLRKHPPQWPLVIQLDVDGTLIWESAQFYNPK